MAATPRAGAAGPEPASASTSSTPSIAPAAPAARNTRAPPASRSTRKASEILLVDIKINGQILAGVFQIDRADDGAVLLSKEGWIAARLVVPHALRKMSDGTDAYALESVAGLAYKIDRNALSLEINVPPAAFVGSTIGLKKGEADAPTASELGVMLNYGISLARERFGSPLSAGASIEAIAFSSFGSFVTSALLTTASSVRRYQRLDTYWRLDMPGRLETLIIGDAIGTGGAWSRPVRFGGVRWGRDFSMRPGFITMPQVALAGEAALPSTVDVVVNNSKRLSTPVAPGPFDLQNVPVTTGAGQVSLVLRDMLGRETLVQQSYYASPRLLAPGLFDFSVEAGRLRTGYGQESHYGDGIATGTLRAGLTSSLTGEARVELQAGRRAAGFEASGLVGTWAVARAAVAVSQSDQQGFAERGRMVQAGLERSTPHGGGSLQYEYATRGFMPLAEPRGAGVAAQRLRDRFIAGVGGPIGFGVSGAMNLLRQTRWDADKFTSLGASVSTSIAGQASLGIALNKRIDGDRNWTAAISVTMPLQSGVFTGAQIRRDSAGHLVGDVSAAMNAPAGPGLGWRVAASTEPSQRARGGLQYNTNYSEITAEASASARGEVALRAGARGTVGLLAGVPFAARPAGNEGFAVVEVEGLEGVPVKRSNQVVATTNSRGLAFVPGLLPWQANKLEIDPADLPMDVEIGETTREVMPYARSGTVVKFPMKRTRQVVVVLHLAGGKPVPEGAVLMLEDGTEFIVGRRGEAWLTDLKQDKSELAVRWKNGTCKLTLNLPPARDATPPKLGPLDCEAKAH